jgi:ADP-ribose pyrophosphatase
MDDGSWRTIGLDYLYQSSWCAFRLDDVELPGGERIEYGVLEGGEFAAVVPVTCGGDVVLVRQWRHPLSAFTLELPSGGVEAGEEPDLAASRELFEETGFRAENLQHLVSMHTSPGRSTEVCHLYRCDAVPDEQGPRPEPTEFLQVVQMPLQEARDMVSGGEITAASTVLGLLLVGGGLNWGRKQTGEPQG